MTVSFAFKPLQQAQFQLSSHCNYTSSLHTSYFANPFDSPFYKHKFKLRVDTRDASKTSSSAGMVDAVPSVDFLSGFSSISGRRKRSGSKSLETSHTVSEEPTIERRVILKDRHAKKIGLNSKTRKGLGREKVNGGVDVKLKETRTKKVKEEPSETTLRVGLDMCSKRGDVVGAIKIYHLARKEGVAIGQYHYAVLLYLCSSAATGTVQPAKSGTLGRSLRTLVGDAAVGSELSTEFGETQKRDYNGTNISYETLDGLIESMKKNAYYVNRKDKGCGIQVSENLKRFALEKGFELYLQMLAEEVPMNEATFTSVSRMAMALGDGEMAFNMVKQMRECGVSPRLRSYSPALAVFCDKRDVERAFEVEQHMLEHGVNPEEPELEALLKVSVEAGKGEKVYYVMHKLRKNVRQVSPNTAGLVEKWFGSKVASRVGKKKWDHEMITRAMEKGGGGWHGKGWLGKGKWTVNRSPVGPDGSCRCCGEKLVMIDLDPEETENFAKSVTSIAAQRERNSSLQKFQKWLDYYGPFEAVVDAANVGLYSQRRFKPSKVNAVVNGIRQMLPSRKWPLIVLHNRRITGEKMDEPFNRALIDKWRNGDALYATPTGSNDDWYWLYAAIKCRSLIVTNDEMRDHLFQLLGNDFFPRWKERHQVRFNFTETGPTFHMPPQCSVVIQESAQGHWHIPIASESENEDERVWLCCRRANSGLTRQDSCGVQNESELANKKKRESQIGSEQILGGDDQKQEHQELSNVKAFVLPSLLKKNCTSVVAQLEVAEKLGACIINFQI